MKSPQNCNCVVLVFAIAGYLTAVREIYVFYRTKSLFLLNTTNISVKL